MRATDYVKLNYEGSYWFAESVYLHPACPYTPSYCAEWRFQDKKHDLAAKDDEHEKVIRKYVRRTILGNLGES